MPAEKIRKIIDTSDSAEKKLSDVAVAPNLLATTNSRTNPRILARKVSAETVATEAMRKCLMPPSRSEMYVTEITFGIAR